MSLKTIYTIILFLSITTFAYGQTNKDISLNGIWIPENIEWERIPCDDGENFTFGCFETFYITDSAFMAISTSNTLLPKCDSILFYTEHGFYKMRGNIANIKNDSLFLKYKVYDERIVKMPGTDTIIPNKIYKDFIIYSPPSSFLYKGEKYIRTNKFVPESQLKIKSFFEESLKP